MRQSKLEHGERANLSARTEKSSSLWGEACAEFKGGVESR